jgi:hypothetical protein
VRGRITGREQVIAECERPEFEQRLVRCRGLQKKQSLRTRAKSECPDGRFIIRSASHHSRIGCALFYLLKRTTIAPITSPFLKSLFGLFLSYKWDGPAENEWVATLAGKLAERGWDVVFDRYRDETADRTVEEFISRIVTCHVFLAVATRGKQQRSWCPWWVTLISGE